MRLNAFRIAIAACSLAVVSATIMAADSLPPPGSYRVDNGRVDLGTYLGWRAYHTTCFSCHGLDGEGTTLAPDLRNAVKTMSPHAFATKVLTRYYITVPSAEGESVEAYRNAIIDEVRRQERGKRGELVMPAWEGDVRVKPHILDLYAYLSARADGALGPGRPKMLTDK